MPVLTIKSACTELLFKIPQIFAQFVQVLSLMSLPVS